MLAYIQCDVYNLVVLYVIFTSQLQAETIWTTFEQIVKCHFLMHSENTIRKNYGNVKGMISNALYVLFVKVKIYNIFN